MLAQAELEVDWVSHVLFESPWMAIVVLALSWTSMRILGRRMGSKPLARASWFALLLIAGLWITSASVTTKREKLVHALDALLLSVEDQDFETFRSIVPDDAVAKFPPGRQAETFTREKVERRLKDAKIKDLVLLGSEEAIFKKMPDEAVTVFRIRAQGDYAGIVGIQIYQWAVQWRYEDGRWLAHDFECLEIGFDVIQNDN